ncbi:MAG: hypothetical protein HRT87_07140 [Legionellales bacterium]|nr:hypothetical protein [Legionellales bacterium]
MHKKYISIWHKGLKLFVFISLIFIEHNVISKKIQTQITIAESAIVTGIDADTEITLTDIDINQSLLKGISFKTPIIAKACIFSNNKNGHYNIKLGVDRKYSLNNSYALYSPNLGKISIEVFLSSSKNKNEILVPFGKNILLKNHSDITSSGISCNNQVAFWLKINPDSLREARPGKYKFKFSIITNLDK